MYHVVRKSPGGKLLRLTTEVVEGKLHKPMLAGDFFLMPSEKIRSLEAAMHGQDIQDKEGLAQRLAAVLKQEEILLAGITPQDIANCLEEL
jgi:hypothetical protein